MGKFSRLAWLIGVMALGCGGRALHDRDGGAADSPGPGSQDAVAEFAGLPAPATPFSIPSAPPPGALRPCTTTAFPLPLGFLPDGRAVIAQHAAPGLTLVRAWDPVTNALEDLFTVGRVDPSASWDAYPEYPFQLSPQGDRIVVFSRTARFDASNRSFQVFDLDRRRFLTDTPIGSWILGASTDGRFAIDADLNRWSADGGEVFSFRELLPPDAALPPEGAPPWSRPEIALSPTGDALARLFYRAASPHPVVMVLFADGRTLVLTDDVWPAELLPCGGDACRLRWSDDGRRLLADVHGALRVWDVETGAILLRDGRVRAAAFSRGGDAVLMVAGNDGEIIEKKLVDGSAVTWGFGMDWPSAWDFGPVFDATGRHLLFLGRPPGESNQGLVLSNRRGLDAFWRLPGQMQGGLALSGDGLFGMFERRGPFPGDLFEIGLVRYPAAGGPPTHILRPGERQSEFAGQIVVAPDDRRLAAVFPDSVRVVHAATLAEEAVIPSGAGMVIWSPDGGYLATTPDLHYRDPGRSPGPPTKEVALWNAVSGQLATRLSVPLVPIAVAFDDRGSKLLVWGYREMSMMGGTGEIQFFWPAAGDPLVGELDLATRQWTESPLPPFVAATRGLVAAGSSIVTVSTGLSVATFPAPVFGRAVFSGDWSVLLGVDHDENLITAQLRLVGVKNGQVIASGPMLDRPNGATGRTPGQQLALSRDGRRVATTYAGILVYCLDAAPP